jgi:hypothetical protein
MRRHVARCARVGVVAPGAANLAAALDDEEVVATVLGEPDGRAEAGEAAPDDQHADVPARLGSSGGIGLLAGRRLRGGRPAGGCLRHAVSLGSH